MDALTIRVSLACDGGYMYDIYKGDQISDDAEDSDDGGQCTTTMLNALGMAVGQAEHLIKRELGDECPGCWEPMNQRPMYRAQSRYGHGGLCSDCGIAEAAAGDFIAAR